MTHWALECYLYIMIVVTGWTLNVQSSTCKNSDPVAIPSKACMVVEPSNTRITDFNSVLCMDVFLHYAVLSCLSRGLSVI
jgi:hypothetical protein